MSVVQYAGEYEVTEIKLIASSGVELDIKDAVLQIDFMENIFTQGLFGSISVADTNDLVHNMPIIGQEFLTIKIKTPSFEDKETIIDNVFSVFKINKTMNVGKASKIFELHFTSLEFMRNNRIKLSKSFVGTTSEIVEEILTNEVMIGTKKNINIEETVGTKKIISPNVNPYKLITNLLTQSVAKNSGSPHFLFYETLRGINFRTVQSLYDQPLSASFNDGDVGLIDASSFVVDDMDRVLSQETGTYNDMLMNVRAGMMGSNLIMHDIYNKSYKEYDFGYFNNFDDHSRMDKNPIYNEVFIDDFNNTVGTFTKGRIHLHPTSTTIDFKDAQHYDEDADQYPYTSNKTQDTLQHRRSKYMELLSGMALGVGINGHTGITAGQMVEFHRGVTTNITQETEDKYFSGKFLIRQLRHTFSNTHKKHEIGMILVKDSIPTELPSVASAKPPKLTQHNGFRTNLTSN